MARTPRHTDVEFLRFPHLPGVELRHSCYHEQVFRTHTHPAWSIGVIDSGSTTFTLAGRAYYATPGQLVVIPPGLAHACNPTEGESIDYLLFYLSREWLAPTTPGVGFPVLEPVIDDPELATEWTTLCRKFAEEPADADRAALEQAIARLISAHARPSVAALSDGARESVDQACRYLAEHLDRRVTIAELAAAANRSRSHLSRMFTAVEGLPPHTYHNQLRVDRAKTLLAAGESLATVAVAAGFSDQSHFSRVFREFTGATPSQYQAAYADE